MNISELKEWAKKNAVSSSCRVRRIPFSKSLEWIYNDKEIRHKSSRFFKVVGVEWKSNGKTKQQLLLDQWEVGTLGFILYRGKKCNLVLIQAKVEPGNVRLAQIAPTCQATLSNLEQVHGGKEPMFSENFSDKNKKILSASLQSEQGTRFFGKRNNNIVIEVSRKISAPPSFAWVGVKLLCQMLAQNYMVNTDARSVLVSSDWEKLVGGEVFSKKDGFVCELKRSYYTSEQIMSTEEVISCIDRRFARSAKPKIIPISKIDGCLRDDWKIDPKNKDGFCLIHIAVNTKNREIGKWDQPFAKSYANGDYVLCCGRFNDLLYFYFELWTEPGLYNRVELGPCKSKPGKGRIVESCWQSDEGGRFYKDKNKYYLVDIGQIKSFKKDSVWLNLRQVQELSMREGVFCNEARSAISLVLSMI